MHQIGPDLPGFLYFALFGPVFALYSYEFRFDFLFLFELIFIAFSFAAAIKFLFFIAVGNKKFPVEFLS